MLASAEECLPQSAGHFALPAEGHLSLSSLKPSQAHTLGGRKERALSYLCNSALSLQAARCAVQLYGLDLVDSL